MIIAIIQLIACFGLPLLIVRWRDKGLIKIFGTIAMAYVWGILVAVLFLILNKLGLHIHLSADIGQVGSYVCIGLAIPLLMFGTDLRQVKQLTRKVLGSFLLLILAVGAAAVLAGRTFGRSFPGGPGLSAMAMGMYTGGSPNFNAIGVILGVPGDTIALGNLADIVVGTVFYIFILLLAKPLLGKFLDKKARMTGYMKHEEDASNVDALSWNGFHKPIVRNLFLSFGCVLVSAAAGLVIWKFRGGLLTDMLVPAVLIGGTVLGLVFSFVPKIRDVKENSAVGHYLILVFSFALSSSLDLTTLGKELVNVILLLAMISLISVVAHVLLCRIFRIDADCAIVTLTAGLYGPAFIPAVTAQLKNERLTAPGLICGALGYAIGTFLGSGLYFLL